MDWNNIVFSRCWDAKQLGVVCRTYCLIRGSVPDHVRTKSLEYGRLWCKKEGKNEDTIHYVGND